MSLLFAVALLSSAATTVPNCSWDKPGVHPFTGDLVASVDRYDDIPPDVRAALKRRMAARQYDELVTIQRDAIVGQAQYEPQIRDMHFAGGRVCRTVTRTQWPKNSQERGLVYCESGQCLLVPTVCRNLSRVRQVRGLPGVVGTGSGGPLESAGGRPSTFVGGAAPLRDSVAGDARSRGLSVPGDGSFGDAQPNGVGVGGGPGGAPSYPTVQGAIGTISLVPDLLPQGPLPAVPEPGTAALWLVGAAGLVAACWRRTRLHAAPPQR